MILPRVSLLMCWVAIAIFPFSIAAQGVAFQASSLAVPVRGEGLTEAIGSVVLQATGPGKIPGGSSITLVYSSSITNSPTIAALAGSFGGVSCSGNACTGGANSSPGSGFTVGYGGTELTIAFTGSSSVYTAFSTGDYLEISQLRMNVNALGSSYTDITATLSGTSSRPTTNPITFTQGQVVVASIVSPSLTTAFTAATSTIGTCAVTTQSFSLKVSQNYPLALTSWAEETSFTPNIGTVSNGSQIQVVVSGVPAGLAITPGTPSTSAGSLTIASPPPAQTSTGAPLTFMYTVASASLGFPPASATLPFTISMPSGSSGSSISAIGGSSSVTATVSLGPSSGTVSFATNNEGSGTVATVSDCPPVPSITSISPTIIGAGSVPASGEFNLYVFGSGFGSYSEIQAVSSQTSYGFGSFIVSSSEIYATIPASFVTSRDTWSVTVLNLGPNGSGGTSNAVTFTIGNPVPPSPACRPVVRWPAHRHLP